MGRKISINILCSVQIYSRASDVQRKGYSVLQTPQGQYFLKCQGQ